MSIFIVPTTTQLQPQTQSNQITVSGAAYSVTLAQGGGSSSPTPIATSKTVTPTPMRRFNRFGSLIESNVAIPAIYGFAVPLIGLYFPNPRQFLFAALPACLTFVLGLTRKKKRAGFSAGAIFGAVASMAAIVEAALRGSHIPHPEVILTLIAIFAFFGAVIGTFAAGIRQGAEWLFGSNPP